MQMISARVAAIASAVNCRVSSEWAMTRACSRIRYSASVLISNSVSVRSAFNWLRNPEKSNLYIRFSTLKVARRSDMGFPCPLNAPETRAHACGFLAKGVQPQHSSPVHDQTAILKTEHGGLGRHIGAQDGKALLSSMGVRTAGGGAAGLPGVSAGGRSAGFPFGFGPTFRRDDGT